MKAMTKERKQELLGFFAQCLLPPDATIKEVRTREEEEYIEELMGRWESFLEILEMEIDEEYDEIESEHDYYQELNRGYAQDR